MSAYRTAARLFPASHVPLLYMGMEYLRTNNLALASHFLQVRWCGWKNGGRPISLVQASRPPMHQHIL